MFGELVRRIFKSPPNAAACGGKLNNAQLDDLSTTNIKQQATTCVMVDTSSKLKPIYWLLGTLSVCMIVVDLLLLAYVNRMMLMTNVEPQPTTRWEMNKRGREQMRQVALKVVREELVLMRQLVGGYVEKDGRHHGDHQPYDDNGRLYFSDDR